MSVMVEPDHPFTYTELLPLGPDDTPYRLLSTDGVSTFETPAGTFLRVEPSAITALTAAAMRDIAHFLRSDHLAQLRNVLDDPEASDNDRFVALDLLRNASIAAGGVLPMCQDTGTAIIKAKKGQYVFTGGGDEAAIAEGVQQTYLTSHLRYSQLAPITMYEEHNTETNLPAEIKIAAVDGDTYSFLFIAKGGGSANKSYLYQETKALLNEATLLPWIFEKLQTLGTAACPPYHLAVVIGGTSAEFAVETAKLASTHYLDTLPRRVQHPATGSETSSWRPRCWHWPSAPASVRSSGASTSATTCASSVSRGTERAARWRWPSRARPTARPRARSPATASSSSSWRPTPPDSCPRSRDHLDAAAPAVHIDLHRPMPEILAELSRYPVRTRVTLTGPMIVARDIAHAKIKERLDAGEPMPDYLRDHCVYYAGPAKTPDGHASGSFGPTTAGRMDSYVDQFQAAGGSMVMLAKGNRSRQVTEACARHGGFYLGSIGGPAARLALHHIKQVEVLEYAELGMEAVWKIDVVDFPAFIVVDDKGNDFFEHVRREADAVPLTIG